ncbi:MAG: hypothetical protein GF418_03755 [Chitinivibrionales bacterium]|nr:hypothetical protein [Chitinivibrionales bacterium]MBD3394720.1 hypothetical protein [Chitinivibrionales bacterium]
MRKRFITRLFVSVAAIFLILASIRWFAASFPDLVPAPLQRLLLKKGMPATHPASDFEKALLETFDTLEVRTPDRQERFFLEDSLKQMLVRVPRGRPIEWIVWEIGRAAKGTSYRLTDSRYDQRRDKCVIDFRSSDARRPAIRLVVSRSERFFSTTGRMAILIEDFEFQADKTTIDILSFPEPLTVSLRPSVKKSAWTAQAADQYNKEVVIQLALEPLVRSNAHASLPMIMVHHSADKIRDIVDSACDAIPNFAGFNNLLGSRALEDPRVMGIVLREIKKRHGYFIETKTARRSVVPSKVREIELPYTRVTSRVPENESARDIEEHLRHLCVVAQKKGTVLAAAQASQDLVAALDAMRDAFRQNGIRLVHVSEIVTQP